MNILLISLPEKNKDMKLEATEVLPLALYSLSSVLKCQGYEVSIIDPVSYTHLDVYKRQAKKQAEILREMHPRNNMKIAGAA